MRRDRENQLDFADIGRKANASTHDPNIALHGLQPKGVDKLRSSWNREADENEKGTPECPAIPAR
jgi:hypothetical protein